MFKKNFFKIVFYALFCLCFANVLVTDALAQEDCGTVEECKALLEKYEQEIAGYEKNISENQTEQGDLNNKIWALRNKINGLESDIKKSNALINDLAFQVSDTQSSIETTAGNIVDSRDRLVQVLRTIYEEEQKSSLEILLSGDSISDFFENLAELESLLSENQEILDDIKELKINLEDQETALASEKQDWEQTKRIQLLQQQENETVKQEKEWILWQTKGEEEEYQKLLAGKEAEAQEIRARLFDLVGVSQAPTFGEALAIAKYVEVVVGIRPALLLAVLTQESNIGKNVGQCYLKNPDTGAGIIVQTGVSVDRVMKPTRDVAPFEIVCKELGRDPYNTLVSCPMSFGYGGAMGPAQFIPSTWMLYRDSAKAIIGKPADPWNIRDAFLMAGLLLKDAGAGRQTYDSEWRAVMVYFSGSTNPQYSFYGDSVMRITKQYEIEIAQIEQYSN